MAKDMKKDATDLSIEEKLKNLYQLQTMLSEIDKIKACLPVLKKYTER